MEWSWTSERDLTRSGSQGFLEHPTDLADVLPELAEASVDICKAGVHVGPEVVDPAVDVVKPPTDFVKPPVVVEGPGQYCEDHAYNDCHDLLPRHSYILHCLGPGRNGERGQGLILAVVVGAILLTIGAMLTRLGWDASANSHETYFRVQAASSAASAAAAQLAIVREIMTQQLPQNIYDQGCRRQSPNPPYSCQQGGNDTGKTSGIRKDRIQGIASRSQASWYDLQMAFRDALNQVAPVGFEWDAYRNPQNFGMATGVVDGNIAAGTFSSPWRSYAIITPIQGKPITWDGTTNTARIPFEFRAYGWSYLDARTGRRTTAQVTLWATDGVIELVYPGAAECPSYWQPDEICQYPKTVNVQVPSYATILFNDPTVRWGW